MKNSKIMIVSPIKCKGIEHLKEILKEIVSKGAEGIIINEPNSIYSFGRSENIKKIKVIINK